jgi:hypothetical protein
MSDTLKNFAKLHSKKPGEIVISKINNIGLYYRPLESPYINTIYVKCNDSDCNWISRIESIDQMYPVCTGMTSPAYFSNNFYINERKEEEFTPNGKRYSLKSFSWYCANCYNKNQEDINDLRNNNNDEEYHSNRRVAMKRVIRRNNFIKKHKHNPYKIIQTSIDYVCDTLTGIENALNEGINVTLNNDDDSNSSNNNDNNDSNNN